MCDLTDRLLHQPVTQVIMHRNNEYKVDSVTSVGSVSRRISQNVRRYSLDVMKVKFPTNGTFMRTWSHNRSSLRYEQIYTISCTYHC